MRFPSNIADKLGFDQVLELVAVECESERGRALLSSIDLMTDRDGVSLQLDQTAEMKRLLEEDGFNTLLPIDIYIDRKQARSAGFFYGEEAFVELLDVLRCLHGLIDFFRGAGQRYAELARLFAELDLDADLLRSLESKFDADGALKSNASKELADLHARIKKAERHVLKQSNALFQSNKEAGYLAETDLSIKEGRVVLPVLSEHKRKVEGLLIDQSATGKISYIEPLSLVHLNNELAELQIARRNEVVRILRELTKSLLPELPLIDRGLRMAAAFDLIRAKARLAIAHQWHRPSLTDEMEWIRARHPLLEIKLKQEKRQLVPLDLHLNQQQRLLVISGPNAGGKSVALKTVGLLQYMLQCGFLVPVDPESRFMLFANMFVDIGDDQSIESDLSTYSSHLRAAKQMVNHADEQSLVLMDEIGTGTDPMFGGPMAQAILESIHEKGAYGVITTHYSNIKTTAKRLPHAVNGAMLFDTEELRPQYKLMVGQAGSSFAYEVARNIGLNKSLIKKARSYTDTRQYDLDRLLAEVQQQKEQLEQEREALELLQERAAHFEQSYRELKNTLEKEQLAILAQAKKEAERIIDASNQAVERTIREIKEGQADKERTKKLRQELGRQKEQLKTTPETPHEPTFRVGERVQLIENDMVGEVLEVRKKKITVAVGAIRTRVSPDALRPVGAKHKKKVERYIGRKGFADRQQQFNPELDVRGMRTEEALRLVEQWVDDAVILSVSHLRLIHGRGQGILRAQIRTYLGRHPQVRSVQDESGDLGGDGVSLIELK